MATISFESLLAQVQDQILQYVLRRCVPLRDAEEIVQDVATRVARNGKNYDHSSPIISWFYEIARTMTIDYLRRKGRSLPHSFEDQGGNEDEETQFGRHLAASEDKYNPYKQAILNEDKQWLFTALASLHEDYRMALVLHSEGNTFEQIARRLGCAPSTANVRYHRGLEELQRLGRQRDHALL